MAYFSGQGIIRLGEPDTFRDLVDVGNAPEFQLDLETDVLEHTESRTGQRLVDLELVRQKRANVRLSIDEFSLENLAVGLYGARAVRAAGTVTGEDLGAVVAGNTYRLAHPKVSSLVLVDSAATPATLTEGTHYEIVSADAGLIRFLDVAGLTLPVLADYAYGEVSQVAMFTQPTPVRSLHAELVNTAAANEKWLVELYRVSFQPQSNLALVNDELGQIPLAGKVLANSAATPDPQLGYFGRMIKL